MNSTTFDALLVAIGTAIGSGVTMLIGGLIQRRPRNAAAGLDEAKTIGEFNTTVLKQGETIYNQGLKIIELMSQVQALNSEVETLKRFRCPLAPGCPGAIPEEEKVPEPA